MSAPPRTGAGEISVRSLSKRCGRATVIDDLSFDVRVGLVTGFLGPNGAGKTTTMRVILGLDRPSAGTVRPPLLPGIAPDGERV